MTAVPSVALDISAADVFLGDECYHAPHHIHVIGHVDFRATKCGLDEMRHHVELGAAGELDAVLAGYRPCKRCYEL